MDRLSIQRNVLTWIGVPILIAILVLAVYARVCHADFIRLDDNIHIFDNPYFQPQGRLTAFWRAPYQGLYIPVAYTLIGLLAPFGRIAFRNPALTDTGALYNPHFFHAVNLGLHIGNVVLVYVLLMMLVKRMGASTAGALIFAFHPFQVESVAWISEFRGLFAAMFSISALITYVYATQTAGWKRTVCYAGWALGAALAILCKPSAVCVPLIAFVIDTLLLHRHWRHALACTLPLLLVFVPFILYTQALQPSLGGDYSSIWTRPLIALDALAFYGGKFVAPFNMILDYGRQPRRVMASGVGWWSWIAPFVVGVVVWKLRRVMPWLAGAALITLVALAPVSGLVPFRFQALSTVADRYMYLAMLGPAIAVAYLWVAARPADVRAAIGIVLLAWVGLSMYQLRYWDNSVTVLTHSLRINPNSALFECNLGNAYQMNGRPVVAMAHYNRAIQLNPKYFDPQLNRANLELILGNSRAALDDYRHMQSEWPGSRMAPLGIGKVLEAQGKLDAALREYTNLVAVAPAFGPAHVRLAVMLMEKAQYSKAREQFILALRSTPNDAEAWTGLGNIASVAGYSDQALNAYARASELDPSSFEADYDMGILLMAHNRFWEAVSALRNAIAARPGDVDAHNMLGVALFDSGNRADALGQFQQSLKIDPRNPSALRYLTRLYSVR